MLFDIGQAKTHLQKGFLKPLETLLSMPLHSVCLLPISMHIFLLLSPCSYCDIILLLIYLVIILFVKDRRHIQGCFPGYNNRLTVQLNKMINVQTTMHYRLTGIQLSNSKHKYTDNDIKHDKTKEHGRVTK